MKIKVNDLVKSYSGRRVVNDLSLNISKGEIVGLLGPNGAGKTTTFYMVVGLVKPGAGKVFLDKEDITSLPMYKRARKGIGYLAQETSIFRKLTTEENLLLVFEMMGLPKEERERRLEKLIREFDLEKVRKQNTMALSGGERRRVEIARSLATEPHFLLLDEPFTGIDPIAIAEIQEIIGNLRQEKGIGILITDHNVRETLGITDRAYIIRDGTILVEGTSEEIANDPTARKYYLGERFKYDGPVLNNNNGKNGKQITKAGFVGGTSPSR
ncbi:MAG: LPS export ABC transporter ATP-binding protein [Candidatus Eremiobacteraeota bacterium]|nr:LPS export ABC transporter ATP-binding protein [Candidatus Eremiobacteraeota bacterium]